MADKRNLRKNIRRLEQVKTWQLLIILILVGFVAATLLRLNNIGMVQRRDAVYAADASGDRDAIQGRLYDLQRFSAAHMNTTTGPVFLENSYYSDVEAFQEAAADDDNPHGNVFKLAQQVCAPRFDSWSLAYVHCVDSELSKYPSAENLEIKGRQPSPQSYFHSFISPVWSADWAGFSVLIFTGVALVITARLMGLALLHGMLRWRSRSL